MKILGITGGIGSGKTAVAKILNRELGTPVIDADDLARKAVEPGTPGLTEVVEAFGPAVVLEDGSLDRKALAAIVFHDEKARKRLNGIVHPQVEALFYKRVEEEKQKGTSWLVYDCPLMVEEKLFHQADRIWLVRAPEKERIRRIVARSGITEEEAKARMDAQMPDEEKEAYVHSVVWNDGSMEALSRVAVHLWEKSFKILLSIG